MGRFDPLLDRVLGPQLRSEELPTGIEIPPGVTCRRGGLILSIGSAFMGHGKDGKRMNADAVTLGNTILVRAGHHPSARLICHELVHVRQWKDPFFPLKYVLESIRHGYYDNRYEAEARKEADLAYPRPPRTQR